MEMQYSERANHVKSVARALQMVEKMARIAREVSVTELSKEMGWPKSTVHGILSTLRDFHYVEQSPESGCYRLGVRFFEVGSIVARSWDIHTVALPHMQRLNSRVGEMVQLATEDNGEVLYLEKMDSTHMMRIVSDIGGRLPMHCTGLGKVLLAYKTPAEARSILKRKGMERLTGRTITTLAEMELELQKVREKGYGMDDREVMEGLRCVATPIFDREGKVRYALSVSGIHSNMRGEHLEEALQGALQCAKDISREMGYTGALETTVHI